MVEKEKKLRKQLLERVSISVESGVKGGLQLLERVSVGGGLQLLEE